MARCHNGAIHSGPVFPSWQPEYDATLQETNLRELARRIENIEPFLRLRRDSLMQSAGRNYELRTIGDALRRLDVVKLNLFGLGR